MTQEQPLVSIGEIAKYLNCSKDLARSELKRKHIPVFYIGRYIAIYPSTLKTCLEQFNNTLNNPESTPKDPSSNPAPI